MKTSSKSGERVPVSAKLVLLRADVEEFARNGYRVGQIWYRFSRDWYRFSANGYRNTENEYSGCRLLEADGQNLEASWKKLVAFPRELRAFRGKGYPFDRLMEGDSPLAKQFGRPRGAGSPAN